MAHSVVAPSGAHQMAQCPGSLGMQAQFPEDGDSEDTRAGEASHWALSEQLQGRLVDVGVIAPNGVVLDVEMVEGADLASDWVTKYLAKFGMKVTQGYSERPIGIPRIHPYAWGTPDYFAWLPVVPPHLLLVDYKFGYGVIEVFENDQLVSYAAGITDVPGLEDDLLITFVIIQPRASHPQGPVRTWTTRLRDLRAQINVLSNRAHEAVGPRTGAYLPDARLQTGPACKHCTARAACPQLLRAAGVAADLAANPGPAVLTAEQAARELRFLKRQRAVMDSRITGLEEQVTAAIRRGQRVPFWTLSSSKGREVWTLPDDQVLAVASAMGVVGGKPKPLTPNQMRDAGVPADVVAAMSTRKSGEMKLSEDSDTTARRVFGTS